jgi:hypothetical protein
MFPDLVLGAANVEGRPTDLTQFYVMIGQQKLTLRITHWRGTIATATRLMKHDGAMVILDFFDQLQRRFGCLYFFLHASISGLIARKS